MFVLFLHLASSGTASHLLLACSTHPGASLPLVLLYLFVARNGCDAGSELIDLLQLLAALW